MGVARLTDQNTIVPAESKYARIERERRYLLQDLPEGLTRASPHVQITDNYITGTRLRLRKVRDPQTNKWTVKLTQKFAPDLEDFPDLTREDLKACIAFAAARERKLMTVPAA